MAKQIIIGAGGGGGKGGGGGSSTPVESPDSLQSRAYARVLDLIGEGEIEGFATEDLRSVYLDRTPVWDESKRPNFSGVAIILRKGTPLQGYVRGFDGVEREQTVGIQVKKGSPVVRQVNNPEIDQLRVTVSIPTLSQVDTTNGNTYGAKVTYAIEVKPDGGTYKQVVKDTVDGKTTTKYQRSYLIPLDGAAPWSVRVSRLTDDSTTQTLQNQTWWETYTEIVQSRLRYPNSAYAAIRIDSQQFRSIPERAYDLKLLRIKIPTNASVQSDGSLRYSGAWNGTFKIAWCANPAWCFYDLLTNARYGLGNHVSEAQVDKWALYQIGRYCDELVPDGRGSYEPRFTCNLYLQVREEAFKVMQNLAAIFRGMAYWASGSITATQDRPSDPVALFVNSNVENGVFTYSGTSLKTRHTVALVSWNDPDDFYQQRIEYVEDPYALQKYGVVETEIVAMGCTSQGQAHRLGKWLLYSENHETQTVAFKVGLDGVLCRPGDIIAVQDQYRSGVRYSGRLSGGTLTAVGLDRPITVVPNNKYKLYVTLPDGEIAQADIKAFTTANRVVELSSPLPKKPLQNAVWMIESTSVVPQLFRVISVTDGSDGTFEITGLEHNPAKFAHVEQNTILTKPVTSLLNAAPTDPLDFRVSESLYETNGQVHLLIEVGWTAAERAISYEVVYSRDNGAGKTSLSTNVPFFEISKAQAGTYTFSVYAVAQNGKRSKTVTVTRKIVGKTTPPADVDDFTLSSLTDGVAHLTWAATADLDVKFGGSVRIRHTPLIGAGATWNDASDIGPLLPGLSTATTVPAVSGTYFAKFIDTGGRSSVNAAKFSTNVPSIAAMNFVAQVDESGAGFRGTHIRTYITELGGVRVLTLGGSTNVDDLGDIDDLELFDFSGGTASSGTYFFAQPFDLGKVMTCQLTSNVVVISVDREGMIDNMTEKIDNWKTIDGQGLDTVNSTLYVRTTNGDPNASSPDWSSWQRLHTGVFRARGFDFKIVITSKNKDHTLIVKTAKVFIDMPDKIVDQRSLTSGSSAYTVTFPTAFFGIPTIGITAQDMAAGDRYNITAISNTGFTITFRNSSNTIISRTFDYMAKGYGA